MRHQRELDTTAGPKFTRWYVKLLVVAVAMGLLAGIAWVIAGLVNFHVLR